MYQPFTVGFEIKTAIPIYCTRHLKVKGGGGGPKSGMFTIIPIFLCIFRHHLSHLWLLFEVAFCDCVLSLLNPKTLPFGQKEALLPHAGFSRGSV